MSLTILSNIRLVVLGLAELLLAAVPPAQAADLKVVATIKPIHALVSGVMDGIGTPDLLVTGSSSPHTFALTPSGARALHAANVVFSVSNAVEPFTGKVFAALPASTRVVRLADAPGIVRLGVRRGDTFEDHTHDDGHSHGHDHSHDHGVPADEGDGHVWLSPENAKHMVSEIARVLAEASPQEALRLRDNAAKVVAGIDAADAEIAAELSSIKNRPYVVFHDAYQYFERRYGLSPVGAITLSPEVQPGARRLSKIRRRIAGLGAVCVFAEPQYRRDVLEAIAGPDARVAVLDPEGALLEPGPGAYLQLLHNLADNLKDCLASPG